MSIPDFPIFGQIGNRGFPDSRLAKSGIGDSLIPDFGRIGDQGPPPPMNSRPNRESGERELGVSGSGPFESDGFRARAGLSFLRGSYRQLQDQVQVLRPVNHPGPARDALPVAGTGRSRPLITVTLPSRLEDARALTVEPMVISFIRSHWQSMLE
jgi:hypothetical protein